MLYPEKFASRYAANYMLTGHCWMSLASDTDAASTNSAEVVKWSNIWFPPRRRRFNSGPPLHLLKGQDMPYFDQLFERLPNGSYRERAKPIAPDPNGYRFIRSQETGRICICYLVPITITESSWKVPVEWGRTDLINVDSSGLGFLFGGNWGNLPKATDEHYLGEWSASWDNPTTDPIGGRMAPPL